MRVRVGLRIVAAVLIASAFVFSQLTGADLVLWATALVDGYLLSLVSTASQDVKPQSADWRPTFWGGVLPSLIVGMVLAAVLALAPGSKGGGGSSQTGVLSVLTCGVLFLAQCAFLAVSARGLREERQLLDGRTARFARSMVTFGACAVAAIGPMTAALFLRQRQESLGLLALVITVGGLSGLYAGFRALGAWDSQSRARKDYAAYLIQGGVVLALLWMSLTAESLASAIGVQAPELAPEILRTLLYGVTLLLIPQAFWIFYLVATTKEDDTTPGRHGTARAEGGSTLCVVVAEREVLVLHPDAATGVDDGGGSQE